MSSQAHQDYFATTHWSLVMNAGGGDASKAQAALEALCRRYWFPLYAYARHGGVHHQDAEDLVQGFFAHFLKQNAVEKVDQTKGRFRAFLVACFNNYRLNMFNHGARLKRGGGAEHIPFDWADADIKFQTHLQSVESPDRLYDQAWVIILLERVLAQLEKEMQENGKADLFAALKPGLKAHGKADYRQAASLLGMSAEAVRGAAMRLRLRYQELILTEIQETCSPENLEAEIWTLLNAFRKE